MHLTAMTTATPTFPLTAGARADQVFPTLTPAQVARVAAHGRVRRVDQGDVLVEAGQQTARFFVVTEGLIEVVRPIGAAEDSVALFRPGQFTGEVNVLSGRRGFGRVRAAEPGEVIEVDRENLLTLVQTDSELSEILMRAFLLRRVQLIARGLGDVVLVGSTHCAGTLRIKEFLTRNGHPHTYLDLDRDAGVQDLLDRFRVGVADIPVVICRCTVVLRNPTNQQIAECLGFNDAIDRTHLRDLVVVRAGPARRVHMLVRSSGLAETMSRYLIRRIEDHPAIVLHVRTEIVGLEGDHHLERVTWRDNQSGRVETLDIRHVFSMTGAMPSTAWLQGCLALDARGFIKTGPDLSPEDLAAARWPLGRAPHLLETSLPGVFAVGDVRSGSVKRAASAVGEGSIAIAAVHQVLHE